jgi:hypothetical protein
VLEQHGSHSDVRLRPVRTLAADEVAVS